MNDDNLLRYSRHIMLPELDIKGQEVLLSATATIIGLGGLGSPAAIYLAASGIGSLILVDDDRVENSNLQRQIIHTEDSIGEDKVDSAKKTISEISNATKVSTINHRLTDEELLSVFKQSDVVLDATDNYSTRYSLNKASLETQTPLVSGAAIRFEGQVTVFDPRLDSSPCYQCLYREGNDADLNCSENGVIAPLTGIIGTMQAMETLKLIAGLGENLTGIVLYIDAKRMDIRRLKLAKDPNCPACKTLP